MLASMAPVLRDAELDMLVYQVDGEEQRTRFLRELPARRKADAVILTALPMAQAEVERLDLIGVHVVVAGGRCATTRTSRSTTSRSAGSPSSTSLDLGHRRIAMIRTSDTDGTTWSSDVLRVRAWRETLAAAGLRGTRRAASSPSRTASTPAPGRWPGCSTLPEPPDRGLRLLRRARLRRRRPRSATAGCGCPRTSR